MTSSRINLRVPPRLIESARAAQYANRETFGARAALDRIAKEVDRRVEAEQRAAPGRDQQRGGLLELNRPPMPRPMRIRRRVPLRWSVNTAFVCNLSDDAPGSPFGFQRTRVWIAPGNGSQWTPVLDKSDCIYVVVWLPLSDGMVVLLAHVGIPPAQPLQTVITGYKVTFDNVSEIVVPRLFAMRFFKPAFILDNFYPIVTEFYSVNYQGSRIYAIGHTQAAGQAPFLNIYSRVSSAVYDGLFLPVGERLYAQDALRLYGSNVPVLGATRVNDLFYDTYAWGHGETSPSLLDFATTFGIMDDLSLTSSQLPSEYNARVTPRTSPVVLSDTVERKPINYSVPEPTLSTNGFAAVGLLTAYDYHGGSYCQDRLADLGLTL